jgi:DNA-directed RNA polymerase subunit B
MATADDNSSGALEEATPPLDPESFYGPIRDTLDPKIGGALTEDDMIAFVGAAISNAQVVGGNLPSFNELVETGITKIVTQIFGIDITTKNLRTTGANAQIDHFGIVVKFPEAEILRPTRPEYPSGMTSNLYPNKARCRGISYTAPLTISARVEVTAHYEGGRTESKSAIIPRFEVAQFPIMVGSKRCHTHELTREARKQLQEDPLDQGGYFIAKGGGEWAVELLENIRFNSLHVYVGLAARERVRGEFISQPGGAFENSSQVIVRLLPTGLLTIEINSMKFQKAQIPFYLIFRLFGMVSDVDILEQIVGDIESPTPVDAKIIEIIDRALHLSSPTFEELKDELNRQKLTEGLAVILERFVTSPQSYKSDENAVRFLTTRLLSIMDMVLLPHVGQTRESRIPKLRYLGLLIYKTFLPLFGVTPPTDRDSFVMKRVHGSGVSLAKAFKSMFNQSVITTLVSALRQELKQMDFAKITPQRLQETTSAMFNVASDLTRLLVQSLTSGNTIIVIRRRAIINRLASSALERKSPLNVYSAGRKIITPNASSATKGSERAEKIRAVHAFSAGYVCPYHSADTGEKVGLEKQLACTATVCGAGLTYPLTARLSNDPDIDSPQRYTNREIKRLGLSRIYVNGNWVGCCKEPWTICKRYRGLRRLGEGVTPQTTIDWKLETNEVEFWLDVGRVTRPLLIVDSNIVAFEIGARKAAKARKAGDAGWKKHQVEFVQNVRLTKQHIADILAANITLQDLLSGGVCEYVAPEEVENCYLAETIEHLYADRHNYLKRYTHCDVPQALCGMAALVSPDANHTQPARVTYETNQGRSTCGWYSLAWPFRTTDQLRFFQFYNQHPLVTTLSGNFILPSGMNMVVAYMTFKGNNQEDSAIIKLDYIQSGGFTGILFRRQTATLEKNETFGNPDETTTSGMKAASYAKLVDGLIRVGETAENGDVVIGRMVREAVGPQNNRRSRRPQGPQAGTTSFIDRSIVYQENDPARVDDVYETQGADDAPFALVKYVYYKPLSIGDKMSSRSGNKAIIAQVLPDSELPYDEWGNRPDFLVNPHSIPSRMVIGQMREAAFGLACSRTGTTLDGTPFRKTDLRKFMSTVLTRLGLRESGHRRMFSQQTGRWLENAIFMAPTYTQRLQKFVDQNRYWAPAKGPTDALTGQPLDGKSQQGGLRLGEMEVWVLCAQALMHILDLKIRKDSDGRTGYYCRNCGQPADYNVSLSIYNCPECGELTDIVAVPTCQAAIVFQHELRAIGIDLRLVFGAPRFESTAPLLTHVPRARA